MFAVRTISGTRPFADEVSLGNIPVSGSGRLSVIFLGRVLGCSSDIQLFIFYFFFSVFGFMGIRQELLPINLGNLNLRITNRKLPLEP